MLEDFTGNNLRNDSDLKEWIDSYRAKKRWLEVRGIQYFLIVPPNKMTIYGEFVGEPRLSRKGMTRLTQLKSMLHAGDNSTFLDLSPVLLSKRSEGDLFFKSDTHWTPYGAYLAYLAMVEKIESFFTNIHFKKDFAVSGPLTRRCGKDESKCGDLTSMLLDYDIFEESYRNVAQFPECMQMLPININLSKIEHDKANLFFRTSCQEKELKVVIFRDSFSNALVPFISANFKEVIYLWKDYDQQNIEELLEVFKPDIVIEEKAERIL